ETLEEIDDLDEDVEELELDEDEELEEIEELDEDIQEIEIDEDIEEIEIDKDEELEDVDELDEDSEEIDIEDNELEEIEDDEELEEIEGLGEDQTLDGIDGPGIDSIDEDETLEEIDDLDEDVEELEFDEDEELEEIKELDEDELKALEEFRTKKELAEHFDETLGEREKKYNKYVIVPEGKYTIGTKKSIKSSLELQQFDMPEVYISIYPVTNSLFEIFIEETGYITTAEKLGYGRVYSSRFRKNATGSTWNKSAGSEDIKGACWHKPFGPGSSLHEKRNHPVVQVSVDDAIAFASWIGRRIPTEAEWESAARTDMGYKYPWGNEFNSKAINIEQSGLSDTSAVDEYDAFANEFKIIDMLGNILEWTSDLETPPIKSKKPVKYCVAKGAARNAKDDATISSRALFKPGFTSNTIGFRCISEIFL
ncbi:MAG: formylglycine-generating enzyme family protein, partial [Desulfobacula sp.]|uniref:SUMF1/EgtB/PvdO family nonheme iron enzyme n=1 Tax=Desulfobacula sp. TaxID=2593537 RepID=UPI0025B909B2